MRAGMKPIWTMATLLAVTVFLIAFTVLCVMLDIDKTLILLIDIALGIILHLTIDRFIARKK
jgi:hypothetical protein